MHHEEAEMETEEREDEVGILMSRDIYSATLSTKSTSFNVLPKQDGFFGKIKQKE